MPSSDNHTTFRALLNVKATNSLASHFPLFLMGGVRWVGKPCVNPVASFWQHTKGCTCNNYRCTYSQCMPRAHLHDLWTNMCGLLLVCVARAFGTVSHACATNELWEGRQSVPIMKEFENVSMFLSCTERKDMVVSQDNETASTTTVVRAINLRKCTQLFFKHILIAFLSGTDVCAQTTPSIAFLKQDGSQSHTSPTENTHCKISSVALRRSAIIVFNGCRSCALHKNLNLLISLGNAILCTLCPRWQAVATETAFKMIW